MSMQCSSILLIADNFQHYYDMKIVDLSSCEEFSDASERDEGYITGLTNLAMFLDEL